MKLTFSKVNLRLPANLDWFKYYLVFALLMLAIVTRFFPATRPADGTVFDEAYFVPQVESYAVNRYYFDPHPPLGKELLYVGMMLYNPDAASKLDPEKLANKVDGYKTPLDLDGIRFMPKVFGSLVPVVIFFLAYELVNWKRRQKVTGYLLPFLAGLLFAFENTFIIESRYGLLSQFLLFFMVTTLFFAVRYYKSGGSLKYLMLTGLFGGATLSTKWLGLSIFPVVFLLIMAVHFRRSSFTSVRRFIANGISGLGDVLVMVTVGLIIYLGAFSWHYNQIKYYAPAADEVAQVYLDDLKNGTNNASFWLKVSDAHRLIAKYEQYVPKLDYTKSDEIGSMWINWPIMARPISYYWETDGNGTYGFVYLFGNPAVWAFSLLGIIMLTSLVISRLFGKNKLGVPHVMVVLLYFANWLPFIFIERVMYMYHYMPALLFGGLAFVLVLSDFVIPRLEQGARYLKHHQLPLVQKLMKHPTKYLAADHIALTVFIGAVVVLILTFSYFMAFAYVIPLSKGEFQSRDILREWHMQWPGN